MSMYQNTNPSAGDEIGDSLKKINQLLHDGVVPAGDGSNITYTDTATGTVYKFQMINGVPTYVPQ